VAAPGKGGAAAPGSGAEEAAVTVVVTAAVAAVEDAPSRITGGASMEEAMLPTVLSPRQ
jgi:hypothetical protein